MRCPSCHRRVAASCPTHGPVAAPPRIELRRTAIPGLVLGDPLGAGATAVVWDAGDGRVAKLARLRGDVLGHEAAILERLAGTGIAPRLHARGTVDGRDYLVLERARGDSLARLLERPLTASPLPLLEILARAIDALHAAGIVHGDLKPENLFVDGDHCTILDYGTARHTGEPDAGSAPFDATVGERPGTPHYMAPEQVCADGRALTAAVDVYAFGAIAFEVVCGRPPFVGASSAIKHGHAFDRAPLASSCGATGSFGSFGWFGSVGSFAAAAPAVDAALRRCLAKSPEQRFASASAAVAAMRVPHTTRSRSAVAASTPASAHSASTAIATARTPAHSASAIASAAALARPTTVAPTAPVGRRRTVALLAVRRATKPAISAAIAAIDPGAVICRHGEPAVVAFVDREPTSGIRAAIRVAQRIAAASTCTSTIHLAADIEVGSGPIARPRGAAIAAPHWATATDEPIVLTAAAAVVLEAGLVRPLDAGATATAAAPLDAELFVPNELADEQPPSVPLVGCAALVADLARTVAGALATCRPVLRVISGGPGSGKTRTLRAIVDALDGRTEPEVVWLAGGSATPQVLALAARALGVGDHEVAEAARTRLPEAAWIALRIALGVAAPGAWAEAAPGALRLTAAVALGRALRDAAVRRAIVVVIDDAHRVDPIVLDTVEAASAGEAPLVVLASAPPEVLELRPAWRGTAVALAPLDEATSEELVRGLLRPVELVPREVVRELTAWGAGNPLALVELVTRLRASGAVRRHRGTQAWFVASTMLDAIRDFGGHGDALASLAEHDLAQLPSELLSLARACAIADEPIDATRVRLAVEATEPIDATRVLADHAGEAIDATRVRLGVETGEPIERKIERRIDPPIDSRTDPQIDPSIDVDSGLSRLVRYRVLDARDGELRFRSPLTRELLAVGLAAAARERLHAAFAIQLDPRLGTDALIDDERDLASFARHARGAGELVAASRAYLELAERASLRHRYVDAERAATDALALPLAPRYRSRALLLRARARYRGDRVLDALDDARAARAAAIDRIAAAEAALEECTILDWGSRWTEAATAIVETRSLVDAAVQADPGETRPLVEAAVRGDRGERTAAVLLARLALAEGRALNRAAKHAEALPALAAAVAAADRCGHYETQVIAKLLLAVEQSAVGDTAAADATLADVIARTTAANDLVHLAGAYNNRVIVRCVQKDLAGARADLEVGIGIAREIGNVIQETACRYNLGELLIWLDRLDDAAATARHAFDLCVRHDPTPIPHVGVLCARVAVARGRFAEAREHLAWVDARWAPCDLPADIAIFRRAALAAIDAAPPAAWREIIDGSSGMTANEQLEVLAAAIASTDDADLRAAARVLASGDPVWAARFDKS